MSPSLRYFISKTARPLEGYSCTVVGGLHLRHSPDLAIELAQSEASDAAAIPSNGRVPLPAAT